MIDAAGAIFVIGGHGGFNMGHFADVWVSSDGGAGQTRALLEGYYVFDKCLLRWYSGTRGY